MQSGKILLFGSTVISSTVDFIHSKVNKTHWMRWVCFFYDLYDFLGIIWLHDYDFAWNFDCYMCLWLKSFLEQHSVSLALFLLPPSILPFLNPSLPWWFLNISMTPFYSDNSTLSLSTIAFVEMGRYSNLSSRQLCVQMLCICSELPQNAYSLSALKSRTMIILRFIYRAC